MFKYCDLLFNPFTYPAGRASVAHVSVVLLVCSVLEGVSVVGGKSKLSVPSVGFELSGGEDVVGHDT